MHILGWRDTRLLWERAEGRTELLLFEVAAALAAVKFLLYGVGKCVRGFSLLLCRRLDLEALRTFSEMGDLIRDLDNMVLKFILNGTIDFLVLMTSLFRRQISSLL